jgi:hypothetical protein
VWGTPFWFSVPPVSLWGFRFAAFRLSSRWRGSSALPRGLPLLASLCPLAGGPLGGWALLPALLLALEVSMLASSSSLSVVAGSALAGGVPSSFAVVVGAAPVPSSRFLPALAGPVLLGSPVLSKARGGGCLVVVPWSCPVSGLSGSLRCRDSGFAPGEAGAFFSALEAAAFASAYSGAVWFVGGCPGRGGEVLPSWFCAVSSEPFGPASPSGASSLVFGG